MERIVSAAIDVVAFILLLSLLPIARIAGWLFDQIATIVEDAAETVGWSDSPPAILPFPPPSTVPRSTSKCGDPDPVLLPFRVPSGKC